MTDYPNHLVRCYILAHYYENPLWQQRYSLDLTPIPNLAIDLVVIPLLRFLPLLVSGKLFLSLAATLYLVGCSAVGKAIIGKPNWMTLVCALTFYNAQLLRGFVNFTFGLGIFLCAFAFWMRVRTRMTPLSLLLCALLSIVAFLSHLSSFVFLGVACSTVAVVDFVRDRKLLKTLVQLVWLACPILIMGAYMHDSGRIGSLSWSFSWTSELIRLLSPIRSYDLSLMAAVGVTLLFCLIVILKKSTVHKTVVVGVVFFVLFIITPDVFLTTHNVSERYVVPGFLMLVLSVEAPWGRRQKAALGVALIAMTINIANITANWLSFNRQSKQVIALGQLLPEGASVFVLQPQGAAIVKAHEHTVIPEVRFVHIIQFWTVSREADISTLFALPGQQPLVFRQISCHGDDVPDPDWQRCFGSFDFVWTYDPAPAYQQALSRIATPAATWELITLWRVNRIRAMEQHSAWAEPVEEGQDTHDAEKEKRYPADPG